MANSDLDQLDATPEFPSTATALTSEYLAPRDGKTITGASNLMNESPVRPSLQRAKNLIAGLRGAIIGDFGGAVKKTLQGLRVAIVGGVTHAQAAGTMSIEGPGLGDALVIETGDMYTAAGFLKSITGAIIGDPAGTEFGRLRVFCVAFTGVTTGAGGGNPAQGVSVVNQLRAKNIPKGWASVQKTAGVITEHGLGNWTVTTVTVAGPDLHRIRFTLSDAMSDAFYAPVFMNALGGAASLSLCPDTLTATQFDLSLWSGTTPVDVTALDFSIVGCIFGQQS